MHFYFHLIYFETEAKKKIIMSIDGKTRDNYGKKIKKQ